MKWRNEGGYAFALAGTKGIDFQSRFAPGARIEVRDTEWLVRRVDKTSAGKQQLTCIGISQLVKDREAIYLTQLEQNNLPDPIVFSPWTACLSNSVNTNFTTGKKGGAH